jgi:hypothetical protein
LLWTSSESSAETDLVSRYVEDLIAPDTVHAFSESTVAALLNGGMASPAQRIDTRDAAAILSRLAARGIDLDDVGAVLEHNRGFSTQSAWVRALNRLSARRRRR